ncbi:hypothetical protein GQ43DRAFT_362913 [Delitschia confertaspora ATCC 74209]|uniref:Zn(2)-C6 fungal-type domain-containing protein n=1 Tax=Delitschia confertaspora ATCC 74209 TaxID=1513339 RepID=A0A9P4JTU4_9PLEO|nr:hypothetical protein GQ43DRAFT_362913 [Delitschia confertaspora ATCC 74209]
MTETDDLYRQDLPRGFSREQDGGDYHEIIGNNGRCKLNNEKKPSSPAQCASEKPEEGQAPISYALRKAKPQKVPMTWIDKDESGDYDPEKEACELRKANRKKAKGKKNQSKKKIKKCIARLLVGPVLIHTVRNITNEEDNWPEDWSDLDSDEEAEAEYKKPLIRKSTPGRKSQEPISDPAEEYGGLTGHACAAGCISCRKYLQTCSILQASKWPCASCIDNDEGNMSRLIVEPKVKDVCQRCKAEGPVCDFAMKPKILGQCSQCQEARSDCSTKPPPGHNIIRTSLDFLRLNRIGEHATCDACRLLNKTCSMKRKGAKSPPCINCKRLGIGCTFYNCADDNLVGPKKKRTANSAKKQQGAYDLEEEPATPSRSNFFTEADWAESDDGMQEVARAVTPSMEMVDAHGNVGKTTKIWTSFCHPIQFDSINGTSDDCSFCQVPLFCFVGHFERKVEVIEWNNGLGYTELMGGHSDSENPTRMCKKCSISRIQIGTCEMNHKIVSIKDNGREQNLDDAVNELLMVQPGNDEAEKQLDHFCSYCFQFAAFLCCTPQPSLISSLHGEEVMQAGCGLRLCVTCEQRIREDFEGDWDRMVTALDKAPKPREGEEQSMKMIVPRADVGFLRKNGLLYKNVENDMTEMNGPDWVELAD